MDLSITTAKVPEGKTDSTTKSSVQKTECQDPKDKCKATFGENGTATNLEGEKISITNVDMTAFSLAAIGSGKDAARAKAKLTAAETKVEEATNKLSDTLREIPEELENKLLKEELSFSKISDQDLSIALITHLDKKFNGASESLYDKLINMKNGGDEKIVAFQSNLKTNYNLLKSAIKDKEAAKLEFDGSTANLEMQRDSASLFFDKALGFFTDAGKKVQSFFAIPTPELPKK